MADVTHPRLQTVLDRARAGDDEAILELYESCNRLVFRTLRKYIATAAAGKADRRELNEAALGATGEAFAQAFEYLHVFDPDRSAFSTWVVNLGLRKARAYAREASALEVLSAKYLNRLHKQEEDRMSIELAPADTIVLADEDAAEVRQAIGQLPPSQQSAIHAVYWLFPDDPGHAKAAKYLRKSADAIDALVRRARINIRRQLEQNRES